MTAYLCAIAIGQLGARPCACMCMLPASLCLRVHGERLLEIGRTPCMYGRPQLHPGATSRLVVVLLVVVAFTMLLQYRLLVGLGNILMSHEGS